MVKTIRLQHCIPFYGSFNFFFMNMPLYNHICLQISQLEGKLDMLKQKKSELFSQLKKALNNQEVRKTQQKEQRLDKGCKKLIKNHIKG